MASGKRTDRERIDLLLDHIIELRKQLNEANGTIVVMTLVACDDCKGVFLGNAA